MGWIRKMGKRIIFAALLVGLFGSWGVVAMESNKSASNEKEVTMLSKNLCDYAITDYEKIKPEILSLFPIGMSEEDVRKQLAEFPLREARGIKIYEQPLLKIENGQRVVENGEVVWSKKAKYLNAMIECKLPDNNKDRWSFEFIMDESGVISENNFIASIDDENFAKRNIELQISYLGGSSFAKVISSIAAENYQDWDSLRDYLTTSGLSPSKEPTPTDGGNKLYTVYLSSDRLDSIYLNKMTPGANWGVTIEIDENDKFVRAYE